MEKGSGWQGRRCICIDHADNTVTALEDLTCGEDVVFDPQKTPSVVTLLNDIPFAHKFARTRILKGEQILKYGEVIGVATSDIAPGEHVHIHNVESNRNAGGRS